MPHDISFNEEFGIIEVRSYGDISLGDIKEVVSEVERLRSETGADLVLSDAREQTGNSVSLDLSGVANQFVPGLKVAILRGPDRVTADNMSIMESLLRSRGCVSKHFTEREDGLRWLRH